MTEVLLSKGYKVEILGLNPKIKIKDLLPWDDKKFKYPFKEDSFLLPETAEKAMNRIRKSTADIVLLDENLKMSYKGSQLLAGCVGKKVLGISVDTQPGSIRTQWDSKWCFNGTSEYEKTGWEGFFKAIEEAMK